MVTPHASAILNLTVLFGFGFIRLGHISWVSCILFYLGYTIPKLTERQTIFCTLNVV
jgi:hypothetical protein